MKRSIYMKIITVLAAVLLCTACGGDNSSETAPTEQNTQAIDTVIDGDNSSEMTPTEQNTQVMDTVIAAAAEEAAHLEEMLQNEPLTQMKMNETAGAIYTIWDDALNDIWGMLKETLDDETMAQLKTEQLDWIAQKEAAVQEAGAEVEGGSMYPLVTNLKAAELTEERVYVLAEYLQ